MRFNPANKKRRPLVKYARLSVPQRIVVLEHVIAAIEDEISGDDWTAAMTSAGIDRIHAERAAMSVVATLLVRCERLAAGKFPGGRTKKKGKS